MRNVAIYDRKTDYSDGLLERTHGCHCPWSSQRPRLMTAVSFRRESETERCNPEKALCPSLSRGSRLAAVQTQRTLSALFSPVCLCWSRYSQPCLFRKVDWGSLCRGLCATVRCRRCTGRWTVGGSRLLRGRVLSQIGTKGKNCKGARQNNSPKMCNIVRYHDSSVV